MFCYLPLLFLLIGILSVAGIFYFRWWNYYLPCKINRAGTSARPGSGFKGKISVVVPCHDQADELRENLPHILEQDYPDFEVVVVDDASTDDTGIILKAGKEQYENLRSTFIPQEACHVARKKLAITLGIRAARGEWVVLTEAGCQPAGREWLKTLAQHFEDGTNFVLGYATYVADGSFRTRRAIYERMKYQFRCVRAALGGKGIGGDGCNLCVRKSHFQRAGGYADNLSTPLGADDLLVSSLSRKGDTRACLLPEATVRQELPPLEVLRNGRVHKMETLRHLTLRGKLYRLREALAGLFVHIFLFSVAFYAYLRVASAAVSGQYDLCDLWTDIPMLLLLLFFLLCPFLLLRKSVDSMGELRFGLLFLLFDDLSQPYRNFVRKLKRWYRRKEYGKR